MGMSSLRILGTSSTPLLGPKLQVFASSPSVILKPNINVTYFKIEENFFQRKKEKGNKRKKFHSIFFTK